ncbi:MAG: hypothetical protein KJ709_02415, partial [Nanoarchaeota archaeon]|nr:hypothetical protein [Nanoarchaeota archaeon]
SEFCNPDYYMPYVEDIAFQPYTGPFYKTEESCHIIEYYSVDNFGHEEVHKWQCVFVDDTAPTIEKTIGQPQLTINDTTWISQETAITLNCEDVGPHPVGYESFLFRYRVSDDCTTWGDWTTWAPASGDFYFPEDSCHELETKCADALGNEGDMISEIDIVDTASPITTRTFLGPFHEDSGVRWIDSVSTIELTAEDQDPHPVGVDEIYYRVALVDDINCLEECMPVREDGGWNTYEGAFGIAQESCHMIEYYADDLLWNAEPIQTDCVFVDKTGPDVSTWFMGPQYNVGDIWWINFETEVEMSAVDPEPHPSGLDTLWYRISRVADGACEDVELCQETEVTGDWTLAEGQDVHITEESCHLIEVKAIDNVEKQTIYKRCAYVDNTAPNTDKTVGEPSVIMTDYNFHYYDVNCAETDCWRVTLLTPVDMSCNDPEPHPVDNSDVCFMYGVDGEDMTEEKCGYYAGEMGEDGYCCVSGEIESFYFTEQTEHNLAFYCVDSLGNKGAVDDEKFKVEETAFDIQLNRKWNLISTPVRLLDDNIELVFDGVEDQLMSVWTYDAVNGEWYAYSPGSPANNLEEMLPGWGYWVLMNDPATLTIGGSLMQEGPGAQPLKEIQGDAWNLVGYYGAEGMESYEGPAGNGKTAKCEFYSLMNNQITIPFTSVNGYWEPSNPPSAWYYPTEFDNLDPGAGYWVYFQHDGNFVPPTTCGYNGGGPHQV